ncbi:MAG TPA: hypothetical protein PLZ84_04005 [Clostridia bacterium]|nr:hypothetical protein [Clostridia bacterium]
MKILVTFVLILFNYVLQTTLINRLSIFGVVPDVGIAFIVSIAILNGVFSGGAAGFVYGLITGIFFGFSKASTVFYLFEYTAVGAIAGLLYPKTENKVFIRPMLFAGGGYLLKELIDIIPKLVLRIPVFTLPLLMILILGSLYTAVIMFPVHNLTERLHRFRFMRLENDTRIFLEK